MSKKSNPKWSIKERKTTFSTSAFKYREINWFPIPQLPSRHLTQCRPRISSKHSTPLLRIRMHNIIAGNLPENIFVTLFRITGAFQVHENIPPSVKILFELWCPVLENLINNTALEKKKWTKLLHNVIFKFYLIFML